MKTTSHLAITHDSSFGLPELKTLLLEPLLLIGVTAFWVVALPFVGLGLLGVNVWDKLGLGKASNPLILRRLQTA